MVHLAKVCKFFFCSTYSGSLELIYFLLYWLLNLVVTLCEVLYKIKQINILVPLLENGVKITVIVHSKVTMLPFTVFTFLLNVSNILFLKMRLLLLEYLNYLIPNFSKKLKTCIRFLWELQGNYLISNK